MSKIALITEELAVYGKSGGIGAAIFELAIMLQDNGHEVDIHYLPIDSPSEDRRRFIQTAFRDRGIQIKFINVSKYCWNEKAPEARSYAVFKHLQDYAKTYNFIHFHDYKGLGFFCCSAKRQGQDFQSSILVVQLHGPTRWTLHANSSLFSNADQLLVDFLERESIARADHVVSPSEYLLEWLRNNSYELPPASNVHIIKNVFDHCLKLSGEYGRSDQEFTVTEVIMFGRHEARKGFKTFCDALDILANTLHQRNISVVFVGGLGEIDGQPSGIAFCHRASKWGFTFEVRTNFDRTDALAFLKSRSGAVVVIPSTVENSPYAVVEAIASGRAVVTSFDGGAKELIEPAHHNDSIVIMQPEALAQKLKLLIDNGTRPTKFAEATNAVNHKWLSFHDGLKVTPSRITTADKVNPKVVIGITHFERPRKLIGAIMSAMRQTYDNIEIIVVDDGSSSLETIGNIGFLKRLVERGGGKFIRQENGYLGAARNTIAKSSSSDYLLFLDDDDLLFPDAVERLVAVSKRTGAAIVNCINLFMDVSTRAEYEFRPEAYPNKVSYIPVGGPLSVAHIRNTLGAATALLRRDFFNEIGGYTEVKGVGFEDYELYVRAAQSNARIEILASPLYLYEVGKPSMVSRTSRVANRYRVFNAVDTKRNPSQWRDSLELSAGQEAFIDQKNYTDWSNKTSPHCDLIDRIFSTIGDNDGHIAALIDYARAIGATNVAAAWGAAQQKPLTNIDQAAPLKKAFRSPLIGSQIAPTPLSAAVELTAEVVGLVKNGRIEDAVHVLLIYLAGSSEVSEDAIELLHVLARSDRLKKDLCSKILSKIEDAFVRDPLTLRLHGAIGSLLITADMHERAKLILNEIILVESKIYVDDNADVKKAFGSQAVDRALSHFDRFGQSEGRDGFRTLQRICYDQSQRLKREIRPMDLQHRLDKVLVRTRV